VSTCSTWSSTPGSVLSVPRQQATASRAQDAIRVSGARPVVVAIDRCAPPSATHLRSAPGRDLAVACPSCAHPAARSTSAATAAVVVRRRPVQASLWSDDGVPPRNAGACGPSIWLFSSWSPRPSPHAIPDGGVAVGPVLRPGSHWFGADNWQDVFSRVMVGPDSLTVGIGTQLSSCAACPWLAAGISRVGSTRSSASSSRLLWLRPAGRAPAGRAAGHPAGQDHIAISVTRWMDMTRLVRGRRCS